jgi:hypothetical protein
MMLKCALRCLSRRFFCMFFAGEGHCNLSNRYIRFVAGGGFYVVSDQEVYLVGALD